MLFLLIILLLNKSALSVPLILDDLETAAAEPRPVFESIIKHPVIQSLPLVYDPQSDASEKIEKVLQTPLAFSYNSPQQDNDIQPTIQQASNTGHGRKRKKAARKRSDSAPDATIVKYYGDKVPPPSADEQTIENNDFHGDDERIEPVKLRKRIVGHLQQVRQNKDKKKADLAPDETIVEFYGQKPAAVLAVVEEEADGSVEFENGDKDDQPAALPKEENEELSQYNEEKEPIYEAETHASHKKAHGGGGGGHKKGHGGGGGKKSHGGGGGGGKHAKGGGKKHHSEHKGSHGEKGEKGYKGHHKHSKGEKGHHDKEDHSKSYKEGGGHKKKNHHEDGYHGEHGKEEKGEKGGKYHEDGKHSKGHSTKGEHNIHKKDEYEKKQTFYDEHHEGGEHDKHGGFHNDHDYKKGGHKKGGHKKGGHEVAHHGKKGHHEHGSHYHDDKGHKKAAGHDVHHDHHVKHAKKGAKKEGKKWGYKKDSGGGGGGGGGGHKKGGGGGGGHKKSGGGGGGHGKKGYAVHESESIEEKPQDGAIEATNGHLVNTQSPNNDEDGR